MIIKATKHSKNISSAINYVLQEYNHKHEKRDHIELMNDKTDIDMIMNIYKSEKFNAEVKKLKYFSVVISFSPNDNDKLNDTVRQDMFNNFHKLLTCNFEYNVPYIVVRHVEKLREHYHIIGLRYDLNTHKFYNPFQPNWAKRYLKFCNYMDDKYNLVTVDKQRKRDFLQSQKEFNEVLQKYSHNKNEKHKLDNIVEQKQSNIIINKLSIEQVLQLHKDNRKNELEQLKRLDVYQLNTLVRDLGCKVVSLRHNYILAHASYRVDNNPSLTFYKNKNYKNDNEQWRYKDMSTGDTGSLIDYVMKHGYSYIDSLNLLRQYRDANKLTLNRESDIELSTDNLTTVNKETIDDILRQQQQKYFETALTEQDKQRIIQQRQYKVIPSNIKSYGNEGYGIRDNNGNIVLYNQNNEYRNIKTSDKEMTFTFIDNKMTNTVIVEGIHDYMAMYQSYRNTVNYIVLNSVNNTDKAIQFINTNLKDHKIYIATDKDEAGINARNKFLTQLQLKHTEELNYGNYKDPDESYRANLSGLYNFTTDREEYYRQRKENILKVKFKKESETKQERQHNRGYRTL